MRTIPELNIDTQTLQDRLSKLVVGEVVSYLDLTQLIGRNVQYEARGCLYSAMRRLLSDSFVFGSVRGEGIKRLSDEEIVGEGPAVISRIRRAVNRTAKKLSVVDFDNLPDESKVQHNIAMSLCGVLAHMTRASTVKRLEARIQESQRVLPLQKTLEALSAIKGDAQ